MGFQSEKEGNGKTAYECGSAIVAPMEEKKTAHGGAIERKDGKDKEHGGGEMVAARRWKTRAHANESKEGRGE